jgi:hypothetical protein
MENRIEVTARSVYGSMMLYPANDQAARLARIAGTKTLSLHTLREARGMGFEVSVKGDDSFAASAAAQINA